MGVFSVLILLLPRTTYTPILFSVTCLHGLAAGVARIPIGLKPLNVPIG